MLRWFSGALFTVTLCLAATAGAEERPAMTFIYHRDHEALPPGAPPELRDEYTFQLLHEALERTRDRYGDFVLTPSPAMHEKYRPTTLEHGDEGINISVYPAKSDLGDKIFPVRIPIHRGLIGYRVLTIRAADQPRFDKVRSVADLKAFRFGLIGSWSDVEILQQAGFTVETSSSQNGLYRMLNAKHTDALSNSIPPAMQLLEHYSPTYPAMAIEKKLLLHYPMPFYFWFRNDQEGRLRAERVRAGLESMVRDGTIKALFYKYFGEILKQLDFDHRRIIELPNPTLDGQDPLNDPSLWYRPGETP
jgi:hypothetical protein